MCLNPKYLLALKVRYKGYEKYVLFWDTSYEEYCRGFVSPSIDRISFKTMSQLVKYGICMCSGDKYRVIKPVCFDIRIELPCKKCIECTRSRAREWSIRCELESQLYKENYFVTLTYNNENVPFNFYSVYDCETDTYLKKRVMTLEKTHTFKFMKLLRQNYKRKFNHDNIRFFMCGEYGTKFERPHYHYILFNLPIYDLELIGHSKNGFPLYRSRFLEKSWKYGFVTIQKYSIETARYTAQYCCKKMSKAEAKLQCREPEFINMSRNKGIGFQWFAENVDKIYNLKGDFVDSSIYHCDVKGKNYNVSTFDIPKAFTRYFKPVTDSKRGLDTEHGSMRCLLNNYNEEIYQVLLYKRDIDKINAEKKLALNMQKYGFCYETDRYSKKYLDYLDILRREIEKKFKVCRNIC